MEQTTASYVDIECQKIDKAKYLREDPRQTNNKSICLNTFVRGNNFGPRNVIVLSQRDSRSLSLGKLLHELGSCQVVITVEVKLRDYPTILVFSYRAVKASRPRVWVCFPLTSLGRCFQRIHITARHQDRGIMVTVRTRIR
ncbi:hypothetical protein K456DRAFT_799324 [Colletotrichum gloeosporioides 23]|nr:hypothetical protein K456DRAFT_799324 [Colletotrichum gloeosporioides 23]